MDLPFLLAKSPIFLACGLTEIVKLGTLGTGIDILIRFLKKRSTKMIE